MKLKGTQFRWDGKLGTVDASELGIPPGQGVPDLIYVQGTVHEITFRYETCIYHKDERAGWKYVSAYGGEFRLTIFND
jgi:hypothetical protein